MQLVVGLGNPGKEYAETRHNAGFWLVNQWVDENRGLFRREPKFHGELTAVSVASGRVWAFKPEIFMNLSGQAVSAVMGYYGISAEYVLVVHDELDLPPGVARIKKGGGHGGHNGLRSLVQHLGTTEFWRLRLGIGHPGHKSAVVNHVLGRPTSEDRAAIEQAIQASMALMSGLIQGQVESAMNQLHRTVAVASPVTE